MYNQYVKRLFDLSLALFLLLILAPLFILGGVLYLFYPEIIFRQKRIGFQQKSFYILKLRSLYSGNGFKKQMGLLLRKTSIDELPQLINILKGEMAFVGPRPLLPEYLKLYSNSQLKRHSVKPGITGLAQINGGNNITWGSKFRLDLLYVNNRGCQLDAYILFQTLLQILTLQRLRKEKVIVANAFNGSN